MDLLLIAALLAAAVWALRPGHGVIGGEAHPDADARRVGTERAALGQAAPATTRVIRVQTSPAGAGARIGKLS
ncbi:hypothetical protein ACMYYO_14325 [Dermacoccaceae bacterium W4C1]